MYVVLRIYQRRPRAHDKGQMPLPRRAKRSAIKSSGLGLCMVYRVLAEFKALSLIAVLFSCLLFVESRFDQNVL